MGSDEYAAIGGGALKLKGAKITKKKKKKANANANLEKKLSAGDGALVKRDNSTGNDNENRDDDDDDDNNKKNSKSPDNEKREDEDEDLVVPKTEAERRHEEIRKKRLLQMAQDPGSRPDLLKTHKERVEAHNTYLSKLSEHHDMPKIGPG